MTTSQCVDEAISSRRSIRAYLDKPVPQETVAQILSVAARAPSGTNTQPWKVYVLSGKPKQDFVDRVMVAFNNPSSMPQGPKEEYDYYPEKWVSPYLERRRKVGWDLYGLLGIAKADRERMHEQHGKNFRFFDAPVGLIFTLDKIMGRGSLLDYGMFLQNIMVAARGRGLDTCPQAAWNGFHGVIRQALGFDENEMLVCGMALGWADPRAIENTLVTERESTNQFAQFQGFNE